MGVSSAPVVPKKRKRSFFHLAQSKGFSVDTASSDSFLTLENLKRYQTIVWNNNHGISVRNVLARKTVSDYVRQGSGWMFVNLSNEHDNSWAFIDSTISRGTSGCQGASVWATLVADSVVKSHPDLRCFVSALPDTISLNTDWLRAIRFPEDSTRFKPIYRVKNTPWITVTPNPEFYNDNYIWAGNHEQGKAIAIPLGWHGGFGGTDLMVQANSAVSRLYWQGLRWLAGDFQNGCINPEMPNFDPQARVDDGSCQIVGIGAKLRHSGNQVEMAGRRILLNSPVSARSRLRLYDLRGHTVWTYTAPQSLSDFDLPDGMLTGLYFLDVTEGASHSGNGFSSRDGRSPA